MPQAEKIGDWDTSQLIKFVNQVLQDSDILSAIKKVYDEVEITRKLVIDDELQFIQTQTTVGTAGAASAPPASPEKYAKVLDSTGKVRLIPLYKLP